MYILISPYLLNLFSYFYYKDLKLLLLFNKFIASFFSFVIPIYLLYNNLIYENKFYHYLLITQNSFYAFDLLPSILKKDSLLVFHHLLGPILNYLGYLFRNDKTALFMTIIIYLSEQGILLFYTLMKILDYFNFKNTLFRKMTKQIYFFLRKIFLFIKILVTVKINYHFGFKVAFLFYIQLIWNLVKIYT